jgi:hypothetical protein
MVSSVLQTVLCDIALLFTTEWNFLVKTNCSAFGLRSTTRRFKDKKKRKKRKKETVENGISFGLQKQMWRNPNSVGPVRLSDSLCLGSLFVWLNTCRYDQVLSPETNNVCGNDQLPSQEINLKLEQSLDSEIENNLVCWANCIGVCHILIWGQTLRKFPAFCVCAFQTLKDGMG